MALTETGMAALVKANIQALNNLPNTGQSPVFVRDDILQAICKGIIDHIKAEMEVTSSGADPQGGSVVSTSTAIL